MEIHLPRYILDGSPLPPTELSDMMEPDDPEWGVVASLVVGQFAYVGGGAFASQKVTRVS